ncbi:hypothetical protein I4U23_028229 [Adineta vaga]|nr:hypothetical protein I4U23_028229 [Adineta vaga]
MPRCPTGAEMLAASDFFVIEMNFEKKRSNLFDETNDDTDLVKKPKRQRLNDIPNIVNDIQRLTAEKTHLIIKLFIQFINGTTNLFTISTVLQDSMIDTNVMNMPVLEEFVEYFRNIMNISFVKNIYMELLNDEIGSDNSIDEITFSDIVPKTIDEILIKRGIVFANLSTCFTAVTCFNRTIIINKNAILFNLLTKSKHLHDNEILFGGLLITILQEFFHVLRRTVIKKAFSPFYERTPPRIIASRNGITMSEDGLQLEDRLFGIICESIGDLDCKYLLNYENWKNQNHQDFKINFSNSQTLDLNTNQTQNRWILPSKSGNINYENNSDQTSINSSSQRLILANCVLASEMYRFS